jgi:hypothetical protein
LFIEFDDYPFSKVKAHVHRSSKASTSHEKTQTSAVIFLAGYIG